MEAELDALQNRYRTMRLQMVESTEGMPDNPWPKANEEQQPKLPGVAG
jgi:hypothetical protein